MNKYNCRKRWLESFVAKEGSTAELAAKLETDANHISAILGPSAKRNLGDELSARVEAAYGMPPGSLDYPSLRAYEMAQRADALDDEAFKDVLDFIEWKTKNKRQP